MYSYNKNSPLSSPIRALKMLVTQAIELAHLGEQK
jgi:hypothetical protein